MNWLVPARPLSAVLPRPTPQFELPGDILREARRRVRVAAALGTAIYLTYLGFEWSGATGGRPLEHTIDLVHDATGLALCAVLLAAASWPRVGDRGVLGFALIVEVLLCAVISIAVPWSGFMRTGFVGALTWVVPIIILFPLLVPVPPATAIGISIVCALGMPVGLWTLDRVGRIHVVPSELWASALAAAVGVGIATVASRTVYGAGRRVAESRQVGSYALIERLGRGGMGEVWKARHAFLARPAAVKLILPERLKGRSEHQDAVVRRFTREAQVTAGLRSPHTVSLFDFGMNTEGTFYYAMELLDGMNLEHFVYRFGPVAPARAAHWLKQACHSLAEAHAQGLVHRDIKPANLFLCRYGRDVDFLKVLDFGLTRAGPDTGDGATAPGLTAPGARPGTPDYMAPEQVDGLALDPRTDLYALGGVGYWLVSGARPFEAETLGELLRLRAETTPRPLATFAPQPIPAALDRLIMACLSRDPADRPPDADGLHAALEACIDGEAWTDADAQAWWARHFPSM